MRRQLQTIQHLNELDAKTATNNTLFKRTRCEDRYKTIEHLNEFDTKTSTNKTTEFHETRHYLNVIVAVAY